MAALVLLSVGVFAVIGNRVGLPQATPPASSAPPNSPADTASPTPTGPVQAATAAEAVVGYLQAVAAGDLELALSYGATPPPTSPLLTDAVFAQAKPGCTADGDLGAAAVRSEPGHHGVGHLPGWRGPARRPVTTRVTPGRRTVEAGQGLHRRLDLKPVSDGGLPVTVNGSPVEIQATRGTAP